MKRPLLTDSQCRTFLRDMREFGYTGLTLESVEKIAQQVSDGTHRDTDVIALIMAKQIDEAVTAVKAKKGRR